MSWGPKTYAPIDQASVDRILEILTDAAKRCEDESLPAGAVVWGLTLYAGISFVVRIVDGSKEDFLRACAEAYDHAQGSYGEILS